MSRLRRQQVCSKCRELKLVTPENFSVSRGKTNGGYCRECMRAYWRAWRERQRLERIVLLRTLGGAS